VPAARTLDCVSVFALTCEDAKIVFDAALDPSDRTDDRSRDVFPTDLVSHPITSSVDSFRFGVPKPQNLKFFGNDDYEKMYWLAVERLKKLGGTQVEFDYEPFNEAALMLYQSAPLAERLAFLEDFYKSHPDAGHPVVKIIAEQGYRYSAVECYRSQSRLAAIRHDVHNKLFKTVDFLLLPTAGTHYKIADLLLHPITLNANLGYYTNFVNLLDLSGLALPNGFTPAGLPSGVTLIGMPFAEEYLLKLGAKYERTLGLQFGKTGAHY